MILNPDQLSMDKETVFQQTTLHESFVLERTILPIQYQQVEWLATDRYVQFFAVKRFFDFWGSLLFLGFTLPICLLLAVLIKFTSPGPVIYAQIRIGRNHKTFKMYKFRSMFVNAENGVPLCALKNDPRITLVGKFMRRFKLDEIPNFVNVLKGEMALVGYRPERPYYLKKILNNSTQYLKLLQIKPGITSLGQVHYGYATNVEEMLERLPFDLDYLEKMSFKTDLSVLLMTFMVIIKGKIKKRH